MKSFSPASSLIEALANHGCRIWVVGDKLRISDPEQVMTDDLRQAIRENKPELLELLRSETEGDTPPAPLGKVGRHGAPCRECNDTWQWPTSGGGWVCSWCICTPPGGVQIATSTGDIIEEGADAHPDWITGLTNLYT